MSYSRSLRHFYWRREMRINSHWIDLHANRGRIFWICVAAAKKRGIKCETCGQCEFKIRTYEMMAVTMSSNGEKPQNYQCRMRAHSIRTNCSKLLYFAHGNRNDNDKSSCLCGPRSTKFNISSIWLIEQFIEHTKWAWYAIELNGSHKKVCEIMFFFGFFLSPLLGYLN